ncbi:M23 family metallopeptidase [Filobacillus milosensis]|nr:peptidoglycan DD-metalloendopeptidase family protein [Filobacillus milosensis]
MNLFKRWRIVVMSDADKGIKQFSLPRIFLFGFITIFIFALLSVGLTIHMIETLSGENQTLETSLAEANGQIEKQNEDLNQFEQDRLAIENRLTELKTLEEQLKEMITTLNPERLAEFSDGPKGGPSDDFGIVQTSLDKQLSSFGDYSSIRKEVPQLIEKYEVAIEELGSVKEQLKEVPIYWPADSERITSEFGTRTDPFRKDESFHGGLDLAGPWGTKIYASGDGVIELSGRNGPYGLSILIDHGNSYKTRYGHLARLHVKEGDRVKQGELIGLMGSTGRSTGVHLHYEVLKNGELVDPYPYMTFIQRVLNQ